MAGFPPLRRGLRVLAPLLPLCLAAGCQEPLALQDSYFTPGRATAAAQAAEALHLVRYNRAAQVARRSCPAAAAPAAPDGPDGAAAAGDRAALARLCAGATVRSTATLGGVANAYKRWVADRARELPKAEATAASAGGGS